MRSINLAGFLFMAACGGSGGDDYAAPVPAAIDPFAAFASAYRQADALPFTPEVQLVDLGSAQYLGEMRIDLPLVSGADPEPYLGRMRMEVAFDGSADPISGTIDRFAGPAGDLAGRLNIKEGFVDISSNPRIDPRLDAEFEGALTKGSERYEVNGAFFGDIFGEDGRNIAGLVYGGTIARDAESDVFDGSFVVAHTD
ncbi:hypothetical protein [Yoonia sediminilitoris]|uniref:Transferrin-binding protein B C-lobe/N-lobe beta barrel domain-containing protein n=1 Tax=Yoonia sediminilitoris TaxID=1286148 RepID=A0A2T6KDW2_9RHOB|nr:hypothetical protein [Yoonia sediminilitoris]PUB13222.1 hypothetical protein C8N45_108143 [Yoonia sediminilitoris]RCW94557.1 hypothetical protein DFP92_108144 [Yoonia sediminilitoris]